MILMAS